MNCRTCNAKLEQNWIFCPYCGSKKITTVNKGFEEVLQVLKKSFRDLLGTNFPAESPFGKGFMVEISEEKGTPKVSIKEFSKAKEARKKETGRPISKGTAVLEPHVLMKEGGRVMQVHLPLIKAQKDISIKKFENSIEVKAQAGGKVYFAIIPLKYPNLVKHEFSNGLLTLRFT